MKRNFIYLTIFCVCIIIAGCQKEQSITIGHSSVEMGSQIDRDDRALHFRVEVNDGDNEQEYKIRFIIKDKSLRDLIGTDKVEVNDTYISPAGGQSALVTGTSVELDKMFNVDDIRKSVEKNKGVMVELYNGDQVIDQAVVKTFRENIAQLVKIDPKREIKKIEITNDNESIFRRAVSDSTKTTVIVTYIYYPEYQFSIDDETYILWIDKGGDGFILNTKDTFTLYTLSESSLSEIKELTRVN